MINVPIKRIEVLIITTKHPIMDTKILKMNSSQWKKEPMKVLDI